MNASLTYWAVQCPKKEDPTAALHWASRVYLRRHGTPPPEVRVGSALAESLAGTEVVVDDVVPETLIYFRITTSKEETP